MAIYPDSWTGPPPAKWAAEDLLAKIASGELQPGALAVYLENGGDLALAAAIQDRAGKSWDNLIDACRANPYLALVIGVYDILEAIVVLIIDVLPHVGDAVRAAVIMMYDASHKFYKDVKKLFIQCMVWVDLFFQGIGYTIGQTIQYIQLAALGLWEGTIEVVSAAASAVWLALDRVYWAVKGMLGEVWEDVRESLREAWESAGEWMSQSWESVLQWFRDGWNTFTEYVARAFDAIGDLWSAIVEWVEEAWAWAMDLWGDERMYWDEGQWEEWNEGAGDPEHGYQDEEEEEEWPEGDDYGDDWGDWGMDWDDESEGWGDDDMEWDFGMD